MWGTLGLFTSTGKHATGQPEAIDVQTRWKDHHVTVTTFRDLGGFSDLDARCNLSKVYCLHALQMFTRVRNVTVAQKSPSSLPSSQSTLSSAASASA